MQLMLHGARLKHLALAKNQSVKISASGYFPLALIALELLLIRCREVQ
jgi:hypothetical protein